MDLQLAIDCRILDRKSWLQNGLGRDKPLAKKYGLDAKGALVPVAP